MPIGMPHPFHIHGMQFNCIERSVLPDLQSIWNDVRGSLWMRVDALSQNLGNHGHRHRVEPHLARLGADSLV